MDPRMVACAPSSVQHSFVQIRAQLVRGSADGIADGVQRLSRAIVVYHVQIVTLSRPLGPKFQIFSYAHARTQSLRRHA